MKRSNMIMSLVGLAIIVLVNFATVFNDLGPKVSYSCDCWYNCEYCADNWLGRDACESRKHSTCDRCNCGYN